jgi:aldehyde:ferredoxin oxidoreductase
MYGYAGKLLRVDLSEGKERVVEVENSFYRKFLGGVGVAATILFEEVDTQADPLGPENRLIFGTGPFQATHVPGSGKWVVSARSPLSGIWGESCGGGSFGIMLRSAGFDSLIVQGKTNDPVYLWIHNGEVEIRNASKLWGMDTYETVDKIKEELGLTRASVVAIGKAGENLVRTACIANDKHGFAGRTGMGAVMGSKNLKAVAVFGDEKPEIANPGELRNLSRELFIGLAETAADCTEHGTPAFLTKSYGFRNCPIKNWSQGDSWSRGVHNLGTPRYTDRILVKKPSIREPYFCPDCPIRCHRYIKVEKPEKYACEGAGPEYESLALLGPNLLIGNLEAVAKLNDLCNRHGLDTISTGATIAMAMEAYAKGVITKEDTGGIELKWGDGDAAIALLEKIVKREGIGNTLAEGSVRAAKKMGKDMIKTVVHAKGVDYPAHDARACNANALNFATGSRGACHMRGFTIDMYQVRMGTGIPGLTIPEIGIGLPPAATAPAGHTAHVARSQDWACVFDSLVQCKFMLIWAKDNSPLHLAVQAKLLSYVTGWNTSAKELITTGERIFNIQRAFNVKLGVSRKDDTVPPRMFQPVSPKHASPNFEPMLDEYYQFRGWTQNGKPTREKLQELGLTKVCDALWN